MGRPGTEPGSHRVNSVFTPFMNEMLCELLPEASLGVQLSPAVLHIRLLLIDGGEAARLSSSVRPRLGPPPPRQQRKRDEGDPGRERLPGRLCGVTGMSRGRGADLRVLDQRNSQVQVLLRRHSKNSEVRLMFDGRNRRMKQ